MPSQCENNFSLRRRKIMHFGQHWWGSRVGVKVADASQVIFKFLKISNLHSFSYLGDGPKGENG